MTMLWSSWLYGTLVPGTLPRYHQYSDPEVFGPLESGSVIICMDLDPDPDSSINKQKNVEKPRFQLFRDLLSLKTDVNKPLISNEQKKLGEVFLLASWKPLKKTAGSRSVIKCPDPRIRIRLRMWRIRNTACDCTELQCPWCTCRDESWRWTWPRPCGRGGPYGEQCSQDQGPAHDVCSSGSPV